MMGYKWGKGRPTVQGWPTCSAFICYVLIFTLPSWQGQDDCDQSIGCDDYNRTKSTGLDTDYSHIYEPSKRFNQNVQLKNVPQRSEKWSVSVTEDVF